MLFMQQNLNINMKEFVLYYRNASGIVKKKLFEDISTYFLFICKEYLRNYSSLLLFFFIFRSKCAVQFYYEFITYIFHFIHNKTFSDLAWITRREVMADERNDIFRADKKNRHVWFLFFNVIFILKEQCHYKRI